MSNETGDVETDAGNATPGFEMLALCHHLDCFPPYMFPFQLLLYAGGSTGAYEHYLSLSKHMESHSRQQIDYTYSCTYVSYTNFKTFLQPLQLHSSQAQAMHTLPSTLHYSQQHVWRH